jgi:hypothetical protein
MTPRLRPLLGPLLGAFATTLAGCGTPTQTDAYGIVGILHDAQGAPIPGVTVEGIESSDSTKADGKFAIAWKAPEQNVRFTYDGITYQRSYVEGDAAVVDVNLPAPTTWMMECDTDTLCQAQLEWELGPGFIARVPVSCDPDLPAQQIVGPTVPRGVLPVRGTCRTDVAKPDAPLFFHPDPDDPLRFRVSPPPVPFRIVLGTYDEIKPNDCRVTYDGQPATPLEPGVWQGMAMGPVSLHAYCDGLPATPKRVMVRGPGGETKMVWSRAHPSIDLRAVAPNAQRVEIRSLQGVNLGWWLDLDRQADGTWLLPPLTPGIYLFGIDAPRAELRALKPAEEDQVTDVVQIVELPANAKRETPTTIGMLRLSQELREGVVPVQRVAEGK